MFSIMIGVIGLIFAFAIYLVFVQRKRTRFIESFQFPEGVGKKVKERYPHLNDQQLAEVLAGLRSYFLVCLNGQQRAISMPSQVVDVAWHEFILFTRLYKTYCDKALGRFLHHTPAEAMSSPTIAQQGIQRAWRISCHLEKIDREHPDRLPILFALDEQLDIADGFRYSLDCTHDKAGNFCASHIACGSGCAGCSSDGGCGGD